MSRYISLLRGINVSGQKKIKMVELKDMYESLGFVDVETYIQSGNVVFSTKGASETLLTKKIEQAIHKTFGFDVPVFVITQKDLQKAMKQAPFTKNEKETLGNKIFITFLKDIPTKADLALLEPAKADSESYTAKGDVIYFSFPNGAGKTKLTNSFVEQKLKTTATTRNWNTIETLHSMI